MSYPALSVLLPVYNGERFLAEAIESILAQTFTEFEFIIIDDGSSDGSGAIIDRYAARDLRIRAVHQDNRGLVETLNWGIALARGAFVARMDADDVSLPQRLQFQLGHFTGRPELAVVGGFVNIIDSAGAFLRLGDYPLGGVELKRFLLHGAPLAHPAVVMRRSVVTAVGSYRSAYKHAEDYDLWLRIHDAGHAIENLPIPVLNYRQHGENVSSRHRQQQELATIVARLAHRARDAGLPDPTEGLDSLDETTVALFPLRLRADVDAELFVLMHNMVSLADRPTIEQALRDYSELSRGVRRDPRFAHFLLRVARGLCVQRHYWAAFAQLVRALAKHPVVALQLVLGKMRRVGFHLLFRLRS